MQVEGYLVITRSKTVLSRIIHLLTGAEFTHASVLYDRHLYSITRLHYSRLFPAGFAEESWSRGKGIPFELYRCQLQALPTDYSGASYGVFRLLGAPPSANKMVCTDLAYLCITGALPQKPVQPKELTSLPGVTYISSGEFSFFGALS